MKFRKKPVVIEAEQFDGAHQSRGVCYCRQGAHVHTIHDGQEVDIVAGDWIIPEPDGIHFYPVKPDIFASTYDPVWS